METKTLFGKIRVVAAKPLHSTVFLKPFARGPVGDDKLKGGRHIHSVGNRERRHHRETGQVGQRRDNLRPVGRMPGDAGAHD